VRNGRAQAKQARKETPNKTGDYEDKNESMIKKKKAFNQTELSLT